MPWGEAELDVDVDGCDQSEEVCVGNTLCHCVGRALCQIDDLQRKFTGLGRERGCEG